MRTADFDYDLAPERIAQRPANPRDSSRLFVLDRKTDARSHHRFGDLPGLLSPGDLLVLNETRVIPARLHGAKIPTGGAVELLLLRRLGSRRWEAWVGGRGLRPGRRLQVTGGPEAVILEDLGQARRIVEFARPITPELDRVGEMPLPPYIHTPLASPEEYQTVYARRPGSAAAPTAGLHFTEELMARIEARGVSLARVVLHVGLDTFAPVTEEDPRRHAIHREWCSLPEPTVEAVRAARLRGGRVVAVGTTTVRVLESGARTAGAAEGIVAFEGPTDLFILPGHEFRAVDAMITNFHLPRSTLLMLVSAFAGRERILECYREAIDRGYRFYSFGDAMLIL